MPSLTTFEPEVQETPLNESAIAKLDDLRKSNNVGSKDMEKHIRNALRYASEVAGEINDIGHRRRARFLRRKSRLAGQGGQEVPEDEAEEFNSFQQEVETTTKKLDLGTRRAIDDSVWLQDVPDVLSHVIKNVDSGNVDDMEIDTQQQASSMTSRPHPAKNPSALLHAALSTNETSWTSKTPTEKYSENNDYIDFYRVVHHANHPGDNARPMPHARHWFAAEEGRAGRSATTAPGGSQRAQQRQTGRSNNAQHSHSPDDDEDSLDQAEMEQDEGGQDDGEDETSDIEVQSERIRITCPITLLPYVDPYRSTKCPHAFEKAPILTWLRDSKDLLPLTPANQVELSQISQTQARSKRERELRPKFVRCPECNIPLTEKDLRPDPVLQKIVQREVERRRRREEIQNQEEEDDDNNNTTTLDREESTSGGGGRRRQHGGKNNNGNRHSNTNDDIDIDIDDVDDDDDSILQNTQPRKLVYVGSSPAPNRFRAPSTHPVKGEFN